MKKFLLCVGVVAGVVYALNGVAECRVTRIDTDGKLSGSEGDIALTRAMVAPLVECMREIVNSNKNRDIVIGTKVLKLGEILSKVKITEFQEMPGFAVYIPTTGNIQVYIADKKKGEIQEVEITDNSHTERQLFNSVEQNNSISSLNGELYIYTYQSPCAVAPTDYKKNRSCVEYYIQKVKDNPQLTVRVLYDNVAVLGNKKEEELNKGKTQMESARRAIYEMISKQKLTNKSTQHWKVNDERCGFKNLLPKADYEHEMRHVSRIYVKNMSKQ